MEILATIPPNVTFSSKCAVEVSVSQIISRAEEDKEDPKIIKSINLKQKINSKNR